MKHTISFLLFGLLTQYAFADYTCDTDISNYYAAYIANQYTCNAGYFLPANAVACAACSNGLTCPGGIYSFDPDDFHGLVFGVKVPPTQINNVCAANFPTELVASYEPNQHTCTAGQYLPANVDACTQCPAGSYCVGGTYTFNENISQGIVACNPGYSSAAGSDDASDCTGNIITVTWDGADSEDIAANNADTIIYGGDIRTPKKARHINGKVFVGWTFDDPQ